MSESGETDTPRVPLPSATTDNSTPTASRSNNVTSSSDLHEAPLELEQFGLDKLNESLTELRGMSLFCFLSLPNSFWFMTIDFICATKLKLIVVEQYRATRLDEFSSYIPKLFRGMGLF